jgi:hypothetical protein
MGEVSGRELAELLRMRAEPRRETSTNEAPAAAATSRAIRTNRQSGRREWPHPIGTTFAIKPPRRCPDHVPDLAGDPRHCLFRHRQLERLGMPRYRPAWHRHAKLCKSRTQFRSTTSGSGAAPWIRRARRQPRPDPPPRRRQPLRASPARRPPNPRPDRRRAPFSRRRTMASRGGSSPGCGRKKFCA